MTITGEKISERYRFEFPANTAVVSTPPPGLWLAPRTSQIDLMVCEVRNDLQDGPHPKAIEYVLSEILVPVQNFQEMRSGKKWLQNVKSTLKIL